MLLFGISGPQVGHYNPGMRGFRGLGDYADSTRCSDIPAGDPYRSSGHSCTDQCGNLVDFNSDGSIDVTEDPGCYASSSPGSSVQSSGNQGSSSSSAPWYASIFTAIGAGAGAALRPSTPGVRLPVAPPWYQSPIGIGAIAIGVIGLVMLLKK